MPHRSTQAIPAGEFKAKCLQLMDMVNREGVELVITKRGQPVAKLVPIEPVSASPFGWMEGTVQLLGDIVAPDHESWEKPQ